MSAVVLLGGVMVMYVLLVTNVLLVLAFCWMLKKYLNSREDRKMRGLFGGWPIKQIAPEALDLCFKTGDLGPERSTEIRFFSGYKVEGGISDLETWILCNLAKKTSRIFEIGTCTGKTTFLLAANAGADARITTLTLKPENQAAYKNEGGDDSNAIISAMNESRFTNFVYSDTPEETKITQLFGDSKVFDETPYINNCDLVFVDGSHAQSYVDSDSRKALSMVEKGGFVIWHDYRGPRHTKGVFKSLNALAKEIDLCHVRGTSFVVHKKPL